MDRNTVTGLLLIFAIMLAWFYFMAPSEQELRQRQAQQARQDSLAALQDTTGPSSVASAEDTAREQPSSGHTLQPEPGSEQERPQMGRFENVGVKDTTEFTVETPLYTAVFTNLGAGPSRFTLKEYHTWDNQPVQLIRDTTKSAYGMGFMTSEGHNVETQYLLFKSLNKGDKLQVAEGDSAHVSYQLALDNGQTLTYRYTIVGGKYEIDLQVDFDGITQSISGRQIDFTWLSALNYTEKNHSSENTQSSAYAYSGGELEQFRLSEPGSDSQTFNGRVSWVSSRNKFFTQVIKSSEETDGARLWGQQIGDNSKETSKHHYQAGLRLDIPQNNKTHFQFYVGPLSYNSIKQYDARAYDMVNVGWSWIRWFSDPLVRYIVIPFVGFIGNLFGNFGIAIILFAISIKLILSPLTKKSFESMAAMRELQPELKALQEKYKDNPKKQQEETMKLYKKAKVNPLGGCLPNLLQFPILITLYRFFQNSILIRQKEFLWVGDLSAPDTLIHLPFHVPFLGEHLGGIVVLMAGTMVLQTQMTGGMSGGGGGGGAMMKPMQYMLPLVLLFVFNNFAAGLSLYYLFFNLLSIGQQMLIHKNFDHEQMMSSIDKKKAKEYKKKNK